MCGSLGSGVSRYTDERGIAKSDFPFWCGLIFFFVYSSFLLILVSG